MAAGKECWAYSGMALASRAWRPSPRRRFVVPRHSSRRCLENAKTPSFTAMLARALLMQGRFGEAAEMLRTTIVNGLAIR